MVLIESLDYFKIISIRNQTPVKLAKYCQADQGESQNYRQKTLKAEIAN